MLPVFKSPDLASRVCPLGVRFRDDATGQVVGAGLEVSAWPKPAWDDALRRQFGAKQVIARFPALARSQRRVAVPNHSGLYVFRNLPGLTDVERGAGDDAFWSGPLANDKRRFVVEVNDPYDRFLPFTFEADLPFRGPFNLDCDLADSPPAPAIPSGLAALAHVPLFSAPARPVPDGLAALRADLWDGVKNIPAAWAIVKLTVPDPIRGPGRGRGIADERGSVLVVFGYPEPLDAFPASPSVNGVALLDQSWDVQIEAYYQRVAVRSTFADVCAVLAQQSGPQATLLESVSPASVLNKVQLQYGREIIVRSAGFPESKLLVT
jgi:hypothetical protein